MILVDLATFCIFCAARLDCKNLNTGRFPAWGEPIPVNQTEFFIDGENQINFFLLCLRDVCCKMRRTLTDTIVFTNHSYPVVDCFINLGKRHAKQRLLSTPTGWLVK